MILSMVWRALLPLTLLLVVGCFRDELDYDLSCAADADCKLVYSCCDGCFAVHRDERLEACDSDCEADACQTRFGADFAELEAFCSAGICAARVAGD